MSSKELCAVQEPGLTRLSKKSNFGIFAEKRLLKTKDLSATIFSERTFRPPKQINDDVNMPWAVALTWELVKSALPASTKKATLSQFDRVFGLRLAEWQPVEAVVPMALGAGAVAAASAC
jgi:hypothetical protein